MNSKFDKLVEKYKDLPGMLYPACNEGWYDLLDSLLGKIREYLSIPKEPSETNSNLNDFKILQIKEKFGTLRFYFDGGNSYIFNLVRLTEKESQFICEYCGSKENIGITTGWITTCCETCYKTNNDFSNRVWTPLNLIK